MKQNIDIAQLKSWFLNARRDLPWRETSEPYAIWVSEIMLQQTQVAVVIPYYLRWMQRFPTIRHLAAADLDEVIKIWEGLGYYSRARNLHEGAKYIVDHWNGELPNQEEQLKLMKGLGPYTIGAILSFAFHQKRAAVDGNVLRVISRHFQLEEEITKASTQRAIRLLVESILPDDESWIINEALIELGATLCQRKAQCTRCPLKQTCLSFRNGRTDEFPIKKAGPATTHLYRSVAIIECEREYLVRKGKKGEVMADLYEFPFFESDKKGQTSKQLLNNLKGQHQLKGSVVRKLPVVVHSFTRYQAHLEPFHVTISDKYAVEGFDWKPMEALQHLAFSAGHRRILQHLLT